MFFHALTFAGSRGSCVNTRPSGWVFKHRLRDPASVNAMKQTCVIVILAYFTWFQHKPRWKRLFNIKYSFAYTWFLKTKWSQCQTFERHYVSTTSSSGDDGISHKMLRGVSKSVSKPLCILMNRSYEEGIFPDIWKIANVIPIFKKGDKSQPSNYRPVALLSCIGKLQERIVFKKYV